MLRRVLFKSAIIFHIGMVLITSIVYGQEQQSTVPLPTIRIVMPLYLDLIANAGIEGTVIVQVEVDERGRVVSAMATDGPELLRKSAEGAARQWVFLAINSKDYRKRINLSFTFKLMPDNASYSELLSFFQSPYHAEVRRTRPDLINNSGHSSNSNMRKLRRGKTGIITVRRRITSRKPF